MSSSSSKSRSSSRKSSSSVSKRRSNGTRKIKKRVRIYSPKNETRLYSLGSEEKRLKQGSPPKNVIPCGTGRFPCKYRGVIFENIDEWNDYDENLKTKNKSIGKNSASLHRKSVMRSLSKQGKSAKRIPQEWRLYDTQTGDIYDMRDLDPNLSTYKP
jgi:hypothetical protein